MCKIREINIDKCGKIRTHNTVRYQGVYFIYARNQEGEPKLLYIGQTSDPIEDRIREHMRDEKKHKCWEQEVGSIEHNLYFASCMVRVEEERDQVEAALIYKLHPPCNKNHREKYDFESVSITIIGNSSHLQIPRIIEVEKGSTQNQCGKICSC